MNANPAAAAQANAQQQLNILEQQQILHHMLNPQASGTPPVNKTSWTALQVFAALAVASVVVAAIAFTAVYLSPSLATGLGLAANSYGAAGVAAGIVFGGSLVISTAVALVKHYCFTPGPQPVQNPYVRLQMMLQTSSHLLRTTSTPEPNSNTYTLAGNCTVQDFTNGALFVEHLALPPSFNVPNNSAGYALKMRHPTLGEVDVMGPPLTNGIILAKGEGLHITLSSHPQEKGIYVCKVRDPQNNEVTHYIDTIKTHKGMLKFPVGGNMMDARKFTDEDFGKAFHAYPCCPRSTALNNEDAVSIGSVFPFTNNTQISYNRVGIFVTNGPDQQRAFVSWQGEIIAEGDAAQTLADRYILKDGFVANHGEPVREIDSRTIKGVDAVIYHQLAEAQESMPTVLKNLIMSYLVYFPKPMPVPKSAE